MTGNVCDNCYPHIRHLPTHPHLASADFIHLLPVATSAYLYLPCAHTIRIQLQSVIYRAQIVHATMAYF